MPITANNYGHQTQIWTPDLRDGEILTSPSGMVKISPPGMVKKLISVKQT